MVSQSLLSEAHFSTHDMKNEDFSSIASVKDAAGRFDDLTVRGVGKLSDQRTAFWVFLELLYVRQDALDECFCSVWFIEGDVVSDGVQIA
jgi:hypothetical protein